MIPLNNETYSVKSLINQDQALVKPEFIPSGRLKTRIIKKSEGLAASKIYGFAKLTFFDFSSRTDLEFDLTDKKGTRLGFVMINVQHSTNTIFFQCMIDPSINNNPDQPKYTNIPKTLTEIAIRVSFAYGHKGNVQLDDDLPKEIHYQNGFRFPSSSKKSKYFLLDAINTDKCEKYHFETEKEKGYRLDAEKDRLESDCSSYIAKKNNSSASTVLDEAVKDITYNDLYPQLKEQVAKELKRVPKNDQEVIENSFLDLNTVLDRVINNPHEKRDLPIYQHEHYTMFGIMELSEAERFKWEKVLSPTRTSLKDTSVKKKTRKT